MPSTSRRAKTARLTVVEQVCYQPGDQQPSSITPSFSRGVGDEQPYHRIMPHVGTEWVPLDCGWLKSCSQLIIVNREKEHRVLLRFGNGNYDTPGITVRPSQSARFEPLSLETIFVRFEEGYGKVEVYIYPE